MKAIITKGLPGSGKSTWARQYAKKNKWYIFNRDSLRVDATSAPYGKDEKLITEIVYSGIQYAYTQGRNIIIDETSLNPEFHKQMKDHLKSVGYEVEVKAFDTSLAKCIENDLKRPNSVGSKVIKGMHDKYLKTQIEPYVGDDSKPNAVIFDIDGTLAKMVGRSPFDWQRVCEDEPHIEIQRVLYMYHQAKFKILIFTGRDGECEEMTKNWLNNWDIPYDEFEIRPAGNTEKDSIIKKRMFDKHKDNYNIEAVYDDRNQVVEMWRSLGLKCLQVADGDF